MKWPVPGRQMRRGIVRVDIGIVVGLAAVVVLALALRGGSGSAVADAPPMFSEGWEIREAIRTGLETNTPVLVYATATWCGPCSTFKSDALSDPDVEMLATTRTLPVYMDIDKHPEETQLLGIESVPTLLLIHGEEIIAIQEGAHNAFETGQWLLEHTRAARTVSSLDSGD